MKEYINRLKKQISVIENRITDRNRTFEIRAVDWQESDKGEAYREFTETLEEIKYQYSELVEFIKIRIEN